MNNISFEKKINQKMKILIAMIDLLYTHRNILILLLFASFLIRIIKEPILGPSRR